MIECPTAQEGNSRAPTPNPAFVASRAMRNDCGSVTGFAAHLRSSIPRTGTGPRPTSPGHNPSAPEALLRKPQTAASSAGARGRTGTARLAQPLPPEAASTDELSGNLFNAALISTVFRGRNRHKGIKKPQHIYPFLSISESSKQHLSYCFFPIFILLFFGYFVRMCLRVTRGAPSAEEVQTPAQLRQPHVLPRKWHIPRYCRGQVGPTVCSRI